MYKQVEKSRENKRIAIADSVSQRKSNVKQGIGFLDNRNKNDAERSLQVNTVSQMMFRIENAPGPQKEFTYLDALSYLNDNRPDIVNPVSLAELRRIEQSNPIFNNWIDLVKSITTEFTHHNFLGRDRRGSEAEADMLDRIIPRGASIPAPGLTRAQFQARFQPLVVLGTISTAQLSALLPPQHSRAFPPARSGGDTEIRAGRKWTRPNPTEGGTHEIWVHTNDPLQHSPQRSGSGPVVRVRDSSGKFLSDISLTAPADIVEQRDKKLKKGKDTRELDQAIANKTGYWTTHGHDRANNQHIRLV